MSIHYLLYRCPECGHDPTTPTRRGARCQECGATFERGSDSLIRVQTPGEEERQVAVTALLGAIDRMGGPATGVRSDGQEPSYEAQVAAASGNQHRTVWWRGGVLGFCERISGHRKATLRLDATGVTVTSTGHDPLVWGLERIRAVQVSSRSIQLNIRDVGLYQMEFLRDSPKRWEDLLKRALSRYYGSLGREVVEYQPKIITRARQ